MSIHMAITQHNSIRPDSVDQARWDQRYREGRQPGQGEISAWVQAQELYLAGGMALDVACGVGRHSLWLAGLGYEVDAVDISLVGLQKLSEGAEGRGYADVIHLIHADLSHWRPDCGRYDLILVTRFLDRNLWPALAAALKPEGLLCYRSFHVDMLKLRPDFSPEHLLQPGELFDAFIGLKTLAYEERRWHAGQQAYRDCTSSILVRKI